MEQLVRDVTKKYTDLLPSDLPFYTPEDLRDLEIPEFVIRRVEVEIYRNLNESIVPPHSEWADMTAEEVREAWEQFIEAIVEEVRMPASYAVPIFETAVADIAELILKPRIAVPTHLFGSKEECSVDEIQKRRDRIAVNGHLAEAVVKYMNRKERKTINYSECRNVVQKVDERLTQRYNSLDWAQFLQPLFVMVGPEVDSEYLRIFFEDRKMNRISRQFDLLSDPVDKAGLIEVLSSSQLLDDQDDREQSTLFDSAVVKSAPSQSTKSKDEISHPTNDPAKEQLPKGEPGTRQEQENYPANDTDRPAVKTNAEETETEIDEAPEPVEPAKQSRLEDEATENDSKQEKGENLTYADHFRYDDETTDIPETEETGGDEEDTPLYNRFTEPDADDLDREQSMNTSDDDAAEDEPALSEKFMFEEKDPGTESSNDDFTETSPAKDSRKETEEAEQSSFDKEEDTIDEVSLFGEEEPDEDKIREPESDRPIWEAFLQGDDTIDEEDIDELEYSPFADLEGKQHEADIRTSPDKAELKDRDVTGNLSEWLRKDEERFKEAIFSGSVAALQKALANLDKFESWRQASNYIEEEIFAQNHVDMYSEIAVEFTDRMQSYFDKFKS